MMPKISICILAKNEAGKIGHALKSAKAWSWCDELLVFDSGSTDDTVAICEELADRVEFEAWVDFSTNRQKIVASARNDWVFILDADEEISEKLGGEIEGLGGDAFERHPVMTMPRDNYLLGRHILAWGPDRIDRLFDRRRVTWPERAIHDFREIVGGGQALKLSGVILHNRHANNWSDYFEGERYATRTDALAQEMFDRGRRVGFAGVWLRPWAAFVKFYFLKRGFLSGTVGLLIAQKAAFSVQLKYARLWDLQERAKRDEGNE